MVRCGRGCGHGLGEIKRLRLDTPQKNGLLEGPQGSRKCVCGFVNNASLLVHGVRCEFAALVIAVRGRTQPGFPE